MNLDQAITTLDDLRRNDPVIQRGRNGELNTAFKAFWDSGPDEATFAKHTAGLLITPSLLYYMVEHPIWMRKDAEPEKKDNAATQATAAPAAKGGKHGAR
jgi:hypothetical protein